MNAKERDNNDRNDGENDDPRNENCVADSDAREEVFDDAVIPKDEVKMTDGTDAKGFLSFPILERF